MKHLIYVLLMAMATSCAPSAKDHVQDHRAEFESTPEDQVIVDPNEAYTQHLEALSESYASGNISKLSGELDQAEQLKAVEIPTYHLNFFRAVLQMDSGDTDSAISLLNDFEVMLKVDAGDIECLAEPNMLRDRDERFENLFVYNEMCWEHAMAYYGSTDNDIVAERNRFKDWVSELQ